MRRCRQPSETSKTKGVACCRSSDGPFQSPYGYFPGEYHDVILISVRDMKSRKTSTRRVYFLICQLSKEEDNCVKFHVSQDESIC
jgi:hypothetical protein